MDILSKIVRSEVLPLLEEWEEKSKASQREGLEIIGLIMESKGTRKVSKALPQKKLQYETQGSFMSRTFGRSLKDSQDYFRRQQLTTSYQFYHGGQKEEPRHQNILQLKSLKQIELSRPLTSMAVSFIDAWVQLRDLPAYQELVLGCLRSIKSIVDAKLQLRSEMKDRFIGKQDWALVQPIRMDKLGEELKQFKPNLPAIRKQ